MVFLAAACLRVDVSDREQRAGVGQPPLYSGTAYLVSSILLVLLRSNKGLNQSQLISAADVFLTDVHINPSEQALRVALLLFSSRFLDNHKLIRPTILSANKNQTLGARLLNLPRSSLHASLVNRSKSSSALVSVTNHLYLVTSLSKKKQNLRARFIN